MPSFGVRDPQNIPTQADSCITSLSAEEEEGATFVAGFGDGSVRLYDKRCHAEESLVRTYRKHRTWVQDVKLQQRGHVMVSGR
jgi:regulator-associated protein of mTOR